ncbi:AAA family ATPase [Trinickia dinghuensis]|uniref:ATP-binding protein n=1 Tax=Trinickia dinghuensis TaxID=2291023 RepID=A0A3D8JXB0_9BURK|nr:ATP-binding protein [Trinickia dinghuensis]RDU97275.1 ATP-binding protein [Trinickia dinghuensis]
MLHSYAATNFQSFRERVDVDLLVNQRAPDTDWIASCATGQRVSKVAGAIGANGSGKTALLKPMAFLSWFFTSSFQQAQVGSAIPVQPHFANVSEPVEIECTADFDGQLWRYVLRCTPQRVLHEALYRKHDRFRYVFARDWSEAKGSYVVRQQDFGLDPGKAVEARPNVSLISWAAQYGVPLALKIAAPNIYSNVGVSGRVNTGDLGVLEAAKGFQANAVQRAEMERLLCGWDLGLSGVEIREAEVTPNPLAPDQKEKVWVPFGRHKSRGQEYTLQLFLESNGTKSAFSLLSALLPALSVGGLAVIDEFESDLHPHMLDAILGLFASQRTNPRNAQLLFTSHAMEVLNVLDKHQVILVEKDADCESSAIRLDEVAGVRSDVSLYAKYMAGAFGAVPDL